MSPTGGKTGRRNSRLGARLFNWSEQNGTGETFDSSAGFHLANDAIRSPDAAWVKKSKLALLSDDEIEGYVPMAPDFVIELRSQSDSLGALQAKMKEYVENGTELGWLIDPFQRRVYVYATGTAMVELVDPPAISGDPTLPGFQLDLTEIW